MELGRNPEKLLGATTRVSPYQLRNIAVKVPMAKQLAVQVVHPHWPPLASGVLARRILQALPVFLVAALHV